MNSSSTLVATVSINYEDFTEGFLTCGTCLYAYDQSEHAPKLLACSHTICQNCLELIASSPTLNNTAEAGCIKCPICRQNIAIPSGGISALPPSFLVNQLFDLVNKKPREFIPKCSIHIEQELSFCETCDCVFCDNCNTTNSNESDDSLTTTSLTTTTTSASVPSTRQQQSGKQHICEACTVIPFSTAIKRMTEILNYRSQQCISKLEEAKENVQNEIDKLESNSRDTIGDIEEAFERIRSIIQEREDELLSEIKKLHENKKSILLEQINLIEAEKSSLDANTSVKVNNESDVKNLSKRISDLTEKNDKALALFTPRENCLICFENENNEAIDNIRESVNCYGKIRTSKTYPPYCTSTLVHYSTHLRSVASVQSIDYEGSQQKFGGDPIHAELKLVGHEEEINGEIVIEDKRDGTYEVSFVPPLPGKYQLYIYIFNRPIKNCPITFETHNHHNPVAIFGQSSKRGIADQFDHFSQPASLTINKHNGRVYVMDSFNSRIKVLAQIDSEECPFSFMENIQSEYFTRSCTGIALSYVDGDNEELAIQTLGLSPNKPPHPNILVSNWRNHMIYELDSDGKLLRQYSHEDLVEPTNIAVDSRGWIFVVDRETIFVFNSVGKLLHKLIGYKYGSAGKEEADTSSIKKTTDPFDCENQQANNKEQLSSSGQRQSQATANLLSAVQRRLDSSANKANINKSPTNNSATLNSYCLINNSTSTNETKRSNSKTNTLSSLISLKRKPKLNPASSLQRGSKAVISAASRIRSTFTLSHSTSLVSAASLQSMFSNSNKQQLNSSVNQQQSERNSVNLFADQAVVNHGSVGKQKRGAKLEHRFSESALGDHQTQLPIDEQQEDSMTLNLSEIVDYDNINEQKNDDVEGSVEPFGIIRAIAIGPDDELIVADESRIRVLQLGDEYTFKRELFVQSRPPMAHQHHSMTPYNGKLCSMTYDAQSGQLLTLHTSSSGSSIPYIGVLDYQSGKTKFIIDSFDSRLKRPSCLATFGQHVIVTDLGNDCIKKYRFY